jgi:general secretion pathway protein D
VTPEITDKGSVAMDISVESSDVIEAGRTIGTGTFPQFQSRRATTSAVVQDGQTLFLGGLISDKIVKRRTGVPILSRIPILGLMFSSSSNVKMKSELFVMVTPHIISSREDADIISQQYKDRITVIREKLDMDKMK